MIIYVLWDFLYKIFEIIIKLLLRSFDEYSVLKMEVQTDTVDYLFTSIFKLSVKENKFSTSSVGIF